MNKIFIASLFFGICVANIFAQKGIDSQTREIKNEARKSTLVNGVSRTWNWGKGKTKIRELLPNPYKLKSRRDILVNTIVDVLKNNKMIVDEASSKFKSGLIITRPYVFSKGVILTKNELNRYAVLPAEGTVWTRGRYTLTIDIQSIDGIRNNVSVTAKVEGRFRDGLFSEWSMLKSSGIAEDEFLVKLVEEVGGLPQEMWRKP